MHQVDRSAAETMIAEVSALRREAAAAYALQGQNLGDFFGLLICMFWSITSLKWLIDIQKLLITLFSVN